MENRIDLTTEHLILERKGVFNEKQTKRFELTFVCSGMENEESILVIGLNPNSRDILTMDTTTFLTLNNLLPMGFSTITVCNLYANIFRKLRMSEIPDNDENMEYLSQVLERNFDKILICYGNTCLNNQRVQKEKARLMELLEPWKDRVVVIMDTEWEYEHLKTIHPLMAGRYFSGRWELVPYEIPKTDSKPEKMQNESEKAVGGSNDYNMVEETEEDKNDRKDAVRMEKTVAVDEIDGQNNDAGKITGKKSGTKRKEGRKESTENDDSDCREYGTAEEIENGSAEADS